MCASDIKFYLCFVTSFSTIVVQHYEDQTFDMKKKYSYQKKKNTAMDAKFEEICGVITGLLTK